MRDEQLKRNMTAENQQGFESDQDLLNKLDPWLVCKQHIVNKLRDLNLPEAQSSAIMDELKELESKYIEPTDNLSAAKDLVHIHQWQTSGLLNDIHSKVSKWRQAVASAVDSWFKECVIESEASDKHEFDLPYLSRIDLENNGFGESAYFRRDKGGLDISAVLNTNYESALSTARESALRNKLIDQGLPRELFFQTESRIRSRAQDFEFDFDPNSKLISSNELLVELQKANILKELVSLAATAPSFEFLQSQETQALWLSSFGFYQELSEQYSNEELQRFERQFYDLARQDEQAKEQLPSLMSLKPKERYLDLYFNTKNIELFFQAEPESWKLCSNIRELDNGKLVRSANNSVANQQLEIHFISESLLDTEAPSCALQISGSLNDARMASLLDSNILVFANHKTRSFLASAIANLIFEAVKEN